MAENLFINRHIGIGDTEQQELLHSLNEKNIDDFIKKVIPQNILSTQFKIDQLNINSLDEFSTLEKFINIVNKNENYKNLIGMGYYETIMPNVIKRNVLENPAWYTAYTPYQAEISQGRLTALLNFEEMIIELTELEIANASLLDEGTAISEAIFMAKRINLNTNIVFIDKNIFVQSLEVIKTRLFFQNIEIVIGDINNINPNDFFAIFVQNPNLYGEVKNYSNLFSKYKQINPNLIIIMACDILSLLLFKSPKSMYVDIAVGTTQRFGVPLGFGGPHAAYIATKLEYKRQIPGRIIGVSLDNRGNKALRMSLQTREQHIRREKATSNICTAQVLLANIAVFYAMYHGFNGLKEIALNIHKLTLSLKNSLLQSKISIINNTTFDTIAFNHNNIRFVYEELKKNGFLIGIHQNIGFISIGETITLNDIVKIHNIIANAELKEIPYINSLDKQLIETNLYDLIDKNWNNKLNHTIFNKYHTEVSMTRYIKSLEVKDISLVHSMIPLGSCTMKLNAVTTLLGISNDKIANIHPFAPQETTKGYLEIIERLKSYLTEITGLDVCSLQPNSGAQGEFAGILAIRRYFANSLNPLDQQRNICLIPKSAHGTNPATAHMLNLEVITINCDNNGNIDIVDLEEKAHKYTQKLCAIMITYPSTHGVFEEEIKNICDIIHNFGGQVYLDGANLNALAGLVNIKNLGVDVMHINLHKTFAIPHGGGGPGMGPIVAKNHLAPFLPQNAYEISNSFAVSSAQFGSASILTISYLYINMLGFEGIKKATMVAILNANYIANKLKPYYPILYTGKNGYIAHECIIDIRPIKQEIGINETDIAKRLMDYGYHAPTVSFPVIGTLMIEPTESENKEELDKFISAMISIYNEIIDIKNNKYDKNNNPVKNAPHTYADIISWDKPYSIETGCFPLPYLKEMKVFPTVNRIDDAYGDRNLICNCQ